MKEMPVMRSAALLDVLWERICLLEVSLNCEESQTLDACGTCLRCREVTLADVFSKNTALRERMRTLEEALHHLHGMTCSTVNLDGSCGGCRISVVLRDGKEEK